MRKAKLPRIDWKGFGQSAKITIKDFDGSLREFGRVTGIDKATLSRVSHGRAVDVRNFLWICRECCMDPWSFYKDY